MRNAAVIPFFWSSVMSNLARHILLIAASALALSACQKEEDQRASAQNGSKEGNTAVQAQDKQTIGQSVAANANLSSFATALKGAGLDTTMTGNQPYTVFAPDNAAFQKLPNGQELMQPQSKGRLTDILTHHIVPGVVTAKDLQAAIQKGGGKAQIATVGGGTLSASQSGDAVILSDGNNGQARVTQADMIGSNGVVHVVDTVLNPS